MTEPGSSSDPASALEREADQLEHHLEQLGDHISDAEKSAATIREQASPEETTADTSTPPDRDDAVGSRMPGDASGGDD